MATIEAVTITPGKGAIFTTVDTLEIEGEIRVPALADEILWWVLDGHGDVVIRDENGLRLTIAEEDNLRPAVEAAIGLVRL